MQTTRALDKVAEIVPPGTKTESDDDEVTGPEPPVKKGYNVLSTLLARLYLYYLRVGLSSDNGHREHMIDGWDYVIPSVVDMKLIIRVWR